MKKFLLTMVILAATSSAAWAFPQAVVCHCGNQAAGVYSCIGRIDTASVFLGTDPVATCDCLPGEIADPTIYNNTFYCYTTCPDWGADGGFCEVDYQITDHSHCEVTCGPPGSEAPISGTLDSLNITSLPEPPIDGPGNNGKGHAYGHDK